MVGKWNIVLSKMSKYSNSAFLHFRTNLLPGMWWIICHYETLSCYGTTVSLRHYPSVHCTPIQSKSNQTASHFWITIIGLFHHLVTCGWRKTMCCLTLTCPVFSVKFHFTLLWWLANSHESVSQSVNHRVNFPGGVYDLCSQWFIVLWRLFKQFYLFSLNILLSFC
jgi:hypothetical protein